VKGDNLRKIVNWVKLAHVLGLRVGAGRSLIHSFTHSFNKCLLSAFTVPQEYHREKDSSEVLVEFIQEWRKPALEKATLGNSRASARSQQRAHRRARQVWSWEQTQWHII
jgi:hypothetical protein